ncbi:hypothetical protein GA0111570_11610 [Raineyella antarctica]|uniref:Ig-like domain (Group 3) n=1 Tax=Raineyella antarctica TaxID=1577474 RepID=A0A1G6IEM6_9ACTN|nr:hypothetical protein [Raineyella antarctica]SDC05007.1 hypothetical protein GA0111570_11610 [Raineyella antarctica]
MPEPLASLDPAGKATVLSYNVPEPISYSGRNFVEMPLRPEAFSTVVLPPPTLPTLSAAPQNESTIDPPDDPPVALAAESIRAPQDVIVDGSGPGSSPIRSAPLPLTDRLQSLSRTDVGKAAASGLQTVLYPNIAGQLDFRLMAMRDDDGLDGGTGGIEPVIPMVGVFIGSPGNNASIRGSAAGVSIAVTGTWEADNASSLALTVSVDGGTPGAVQLQSDGGWSTQLTFTKPGVHQIVARITGSGWSSIQKRQVNVQDSATASISVTLDTGDTNPAPVLPTVTLSEPGPDTSFVEPSGVVAVTVAGTTTSGPGTTVTGVTVVDQTTGTSATVAPDGAGQWSTEILLDGVGRHSISITATDGLKRQSAPVTVMARILATQPFRRLKNRLMLVETLNLSSFLGSFGAGRVIKTFSLLPGEETTISLKSWTKSAESRKTGSSIVDSDATEAADSFEDSLSAEQTSKEVQSEAFAYKVGATASATWGWGSASINAEVSGSANSAREEAVKNVSAATRKHSMKASSNRNVTVNTEYTASQETGTEESTARTISNINASRTLNFVFRQMNQEHITLIHLTNVRIALYTEDLALDAEHKPAHVTDPVTGEQVLDIRRNYQEVPLPQLQTLLDTAISPVWHAKVRDAITFALSGIPDYQDELRQVFEWVTPTKDGQPVDGATYVRFPRNLSTDFTDPVSHQVISVPGIVLAYDHIVMRTEGVMVDSVLGQGQGLDDYSRNLQDVAVAERQVAVAERQAQVEREKLARKLVTDRDKAGAEIFAQVFPPPPLAPTSTTTTQRPAGKP